MTLPTIFELRSKASQYSDFLQNIRNSPPVRKSPPLPYLPTQAPPTPGLGTRLNQSYPPTQAPPTPGLGTRLDQSYPPTQAPPTPHLARYRRNLASYPGPTHTYHCPATVRTLHHVFKARDIIQYQQSTGNVHV